MDPMGLGLLGSLSSLVFRRSGLPKSPNQRKGSLIQGSLIIDKIRNYRFGYRWGMLEHTQGEP